MKIKVTSEEELHEVAAELFHVLANLVYWTDRWESEHGSVLLAAKNKWKRKAQDLMIKYNISKTHHQTEIKIEIDGDNVD